VDQLNQILNILGTPSEADLQKVGSERAQVYIRGLQKTKKIPFSKLFPKTTPKAPDVFYRFPAGTKFFSDSAALDLLEKLLTFDPSQRLTVEQALAHPYLEAYHDEQDEPSHESAFDFSFESAVGVDEIRDLITEEYKAYKSSMQQPPGGTPHRPTQPYRDAIDENIPDDSKLQPVAANVGNQIGKPPPADEALERELAGMAVV
ncbi:MAG: hypothetical protein BJ554DRAFT_1396, partial [Olpidium bornovanus]